MSSPDKLKRIYKIILNNIADSTICGYGAGTYGEQSITTYRILLEDKPYLERAFENDSVLIALEDNSLELSHLLLMTEQDIQDIFDDSSNKSISEIITNKINQSICQAGLDGLTIGNLWKILIDGKDESGGRRVYDKRRLQDQCRIRGEPGYILGMENAFMFMLRSIGKPLTPEYIQSLHKQVLFFVSTENGPIPGNLTHVGRMPSGGAGRRVKFELADLNEIKEFGFADLYIPNYNSSLYLSQCRTDSELQIFIDQVNQNYAEGCRTEKFNNVNTILLMRSITKELEQDISLAGSDENKLLAIMKFAKKMDILHPFSDCNMRTIVLLIYKLEIEHHLTLSAMQNPNEMDIKSSFWMVENQIKPGQNRYKRIISRYAFGEIRVDLEKAINLS